MRVFFKMKRLKAEPCDCLHWRCNVLPSWMFIKQRVYACVHTRPTCLQQLCWWSPYLLCGFNLRFNGAGKANLIILISVFLGVFITNISNYEHHLIITNFYTESCLDSVYAKTFNWQLAVIWVSFSIVELLLGRLGRDVTLSPFGNWDIFSEIITCTGDIYIMKCELSIVLMRYVNIVGLFTRRPTTKLWNI